MHSSSAQDTRSNASPGIARRLASEIDQAMRHGQWERADRLATDAARLMHESPRLVERLARLRLAQGRAETALLIIDTARMQSASLRFLRSIALLALGRSTEAHLDLNEWSRQSGSPLEARRLLALLETECCDRDAAVAALLRNLEQIEDPHTLALLLLDSIEQDRPEQTSQWSQRLLAVSRWSPIAVDPTALLATLGINAANIKIAAPTTEHIETLAMELTVAEHVIPSLVRAQQIDFDAHHVELLSKAIEHALPNLIQQSPACECVVRLALLRDETNEALNWAKRGLEFNPMSASLSMLVHELEAKAAPMHEAVPTRRRRKAA